MTGAIRTPAYLGGIYHVNDPTIRLIPETERIVHGTRRPVVVLSGPDTNSDPNWAYVLACPLSTSPRYKTRFDVQLARGQGNLDKPTWVRIPAIQALMKSDLQDRLGILEERVLTQIQARIAEYMGLI